ncbi:MAG: hypothetical protein ACYTFO_04475 [Planctomycetota bacterium]|jgi:hypothetical protein
MALIALGVTRCALCEEILTDRDDIVATTHFIADQGDHLWRYSDAGMHKTCFLQWKHKAEFVARYNEFLEELRRRLGGRRQKMLDTGEIVEFRWWKWWSD